MPPSAPTLINLPPPPSDPVTPSDLPGTPNSATTSMSELSTVAIKDGHRGHLPHNSRNAPQPDAERADRISRLAGLERVTAASARYPSTPISNLTPGAAAPAQQYYQHNNPASASVAGSVPPSGYFDAAGNPLMGRERSTVDSASATASVGGRTTTWASGEGDSDAGVSEGDKASTMANEDDDGDVDMLDEQERMERSSVVSDTTGSLVAFGEGARTPARQTAPFGLPKGGGQQGTMGRGENLTPTAQSGLLHHQQQQQQQQQGSREDGSVYD